MDWYRIFVLAKRERSMTLKKKSFRFLVILPILLPLAIYPVAKLIQVTSVRSVQVFYDENTSELAGELREVLEYQNEGDFEPQPYSVELKKCSREELIQEQRMFVEKIQGNAVLGIVELTRLSPGEVPIAVIHTGAIGKERELFRERVVTAARMLDGERGNNFSSKRESQIQVRLEVGAGLAAKSKEPSKLLGGQKSGLLRLGVAIFAILAMQTSVRLSTRPLLMGLSKERMENSLVVLLTTFSGKELAAGKLSAALSLGFALMLWYGGLLFVPCYALGIFSTKDIVIVFCFTLCSLMLQAGIFFGFGAAAKNPEDANRVSMPFELLEMASSFVLLAVISSPDSEVSRTLCYAPMVGVYVAISRGVLSNSFPLWQLLLCFLVHFSVGLCSLNAALRAGDAESLLSERKFLWRVFWFGNAPKQNPLPENRG